MDRDSSGKFAAHCLLSSCILACLLVTLGSRAKPQPAPANLSRLVSAIRSKSEKLKTAPAVRHAYETFLGEHHLPPDSVSYSDFVVVRTVFEATRDAGFWNMHWNITDQPPNSDRIWSQWMSEVHPSFARQTATAECDELSALFAFLASRSGVKPVGLFWPYPNHTVAVWSARQATAGGNHATSAPVVRVVIPTSQIFLTENDSFDTHGFDPWRQKTIYDYTRKDVPDSFELPQPLFDFFLSQLDKYAGASTETLQRLRNLRDGVFQHSLRPEQAGREALRRAANARGSEDQVAFQHFADDFLNASR